MWLAGGGGPAGEIALDLDFLGRGGFSLKATLILFFFFFGPQLNDLAIMMKLLHLSLKYAFFRRKILDVSELA